jgi:adenylylsulfate kinase
MFREKKRRSIVKTISWRVIATTTITLIVFVFSGKFKLALAVGGVEAIVKTALYFFHERAWDKINFGRKPVKSFILWFTGLSGSGKSTLADKVFAYLKKRNINIERLDGDVVRSVFPQTGFTKEDRDSHIRRIGFLASLLERNGIIVISSFISPYKEARGFVRGQCIDFVEVYVKSSVKECEKRDVKGLYKKARLGEINNFTGVSDPYEPPENPEIIVDTDNQSVDESFEIIQKYINKLLDKG